jgi:hypothetical protein
VQYAKPPARGSTKICVFREIARLLLRKSNINFALWQGTNCPVRKQEESPFMRQLSGLAAEQPPENKIYNKIN